MTSLTKFGEINDSINQKRWNIRLFVIAGRGPAYTEMALRALCLFADRLLQRKLRVFDVTSV